MLEFLKDAESQVLVFAVRVMIRGDGAVWHRSSISMKIAGWLLSPLRPPWIGGVTGDATGTRMAEQRATGSKAPPSKPLPGAPESWLDAEEALAPFDRRLKEAIAERGQLGFAVAHHFARSGKRIRARLALASAAALKVPERDALSLAVACELLHNASLVHDDLQDRDTTRRGQPTVWALLGEPLAINLGDYLLTRAIDVAASCGAPGSVCTALVRCFAARTLQAIRGQVDDNTAVGDSSLSVERYESIARAKTGPLLALPVEGAMILADVAPDLRAVACEVMELLGTSFQVQDDLADLYGLKGREEVASDLRNGRLSAPVVHFLALASEDERSRFLRFRASSDRTAEANYWLWRLRSSAAIEATIDHARVLSERGRTGLAELPPALAAVLAAAASRVGESLSQIEMAFPRSRVWSAAPMARRDRRPAEAGA